MFDFDLGTFEDDLHNSLRTYAQENSILKRQLEDAIKIAKGVDAMYQQNTKLKAEVIELTNSRDDLQRKLKLALHQIADFEAKLNRDDGGKQKLQDQLSKLLSKYGDVTSIEELLARYESEVQRLRSTNDQLESKNKSLSSSIIGFLNHARVNLGERFTNLEQIIPFLEEFGRESGRAERSPFKVGASGFFGQYGPGDQVEFNESTEINSDVGNLGGSKFRTTTKKTQSETRRTSTTTDNSNASASPDLLESRRVSGTGAYSSIGADFSGNSLLIGEENYSSPSPFLGSPRYSAPSSFFRSRDVTVDVDLGDQRSKLPKSDNRSKADAQRSSRSTVPRNPSYVPAPTFFRQDSNFTVVNRPTGASTSVPLRAGSNFRAGADSLRNTPPRRISAHSQSPSFLSPSEPSDIASRGVNMSTFPAFGPNQAYVPGPGFPRVPGYVPLVNLESEVQQLDQETLTKEDKNRLRKYNDMKRLIKKYHRQMDAMNQEIEDLRNENIDLHHELEKAESDIERIQSKAQNDISLIEFTHKNQMQELERRIKKLQGEKSKLESQVNRLTQQLRESKEFPAPIETRDIQFEPAEHHDNTRLKEDLLNARNERAQLQAKLRDAQARLENEKADLHNQLEQRDLILNERQKEINTLKLLVNQKPTIPEKENDTKKTQLEKTVHVLKQKFSTAVGEMNAAKKDNEKLENHVQQLESKNHTLEQRNVEQETKIVTLETRIKEVQTLAAQAKENVEIPHSVWQQAPIPEYLRRSVMVHASNSSLRGDQKVHTILKHVFDYYEEQADSLVSERNSAQEEISRVNTHFENFLRRLGPLVIGENISLEDFYNGNGPQRIFQGIESHQAALAKSDAIAEKFQSDLITLMDQFNIAAVPGMSIVQALKKHFDELQAKNANHSKRCRKLEHELEEAQRAVIDIEQNTSPKRVERSLRNQLEKLQDENHMLKKQVQTLKHSFQETIQGLESNRESDLLDGVSKSGKAGTSPRTRVPPLDVKGIGSRDRQEGSDDEDNFVSRDVDPEIQEKLHESQVTHQRQLNIIKELESRNKGLTDSTQHLQDRVDDLTRLYNEKEREIQDLLNAQSKIGSSSTHGSSQELMATYSKTIQELQQQNEYYRQQIITMTQEIETFKHSSSSLQVELQKLKDIKAKLEDEIRMLKEALDREKILSHSKIRSAEVDAESAYTQKLQSEITRFETIIKDIYSRAAELFQYPVFVSGSITDGTLRDLLEKSGNDYKNLVELNRSVREMIGCPSYQPTQDAVAALLAQQQ